MVQYYKGQVLQVGLLENSYENIKMVRNRNLDNTSVTIIKCMALRNGVLVATGKHC